MGNRSSNKNGRPVLIEDRHLLYEAAVQDISGDLDIAERVFRQHNGRKPRRLREDFCGTAALCCAWARRNKENQAWGVDNHRPTLDWAHHHQLTQAGEAAERVTLIEGDVLDADTPWVEVVMALNFSYQVFKTRDLLRRYMKQAHKALVPGGVFIMDIFGGTEAMTELKENRQVSGEDTPDGRRIKAFTYIWEQVRFNPIDHHILCHIHFKLANGRTIKRAFTYDWRLWTLPELREVMLEAGFKTADVYLEGWDRRGNEPDGKFRKRRHYENQEGWLGYVVGTRQPAGKNAPDCEY